MFSSQAPLGGALQHPNKGKFKLLLDVMKTHLAAVLTGLLRL